MTPIRIDGGRPGTAYDTDWWAAVHTLYDEAFPGLPAGIRAAQAVGADWRTVTTPFAMFEGDRCIAHVGLISHPCVLAGEVVTCAGIHAVCTTADRRMRGHCRTLLGHALAWAAPNHPLAKLHTDDPPVYESSGFRVLPTHRFQSAIPASSGVSWRTLKPLESAEDRGILDRLLATRTAASGVCATAEPGWMVTIDAALSGRLAAGFRYLPDHDVVVCGQSLAGGGVLVVEVIGAVLPPAEVVHGALADLGTSFVWSFSPDRFDPDAEAVLAPAAIGSFMVRGTWPVVGAFGMSPLWEH